MKMEGLNEIPEEWFKKARGFKYALELCLKEWNHSYEKHKSSIANANLILLEPMNHLTYTSIELYLRSYLHVKGKSWSDTKTIMKTKDSKHDLGSLIDECTKYDTVFKQPPLEHIDKIAGSTKNYPGARYPESGASASYSDLLILETLDRIIAPCFKKPAPTI